MFPTFLSLVMSPMLLHRLILSEPKMNEGKGMERDVQVMTPKLMALGYPVVPHTE